MTRLPIKECTVQQTYMPAPWFGNQAKSVLYCRHICPRLDSATKQRVYCTADIYARAMTRLPSKECTVQQTYMPVPWLGYQAKCVMYCRHISVIQQLHSRVRKLLRPKHLIFLITCKINCSVTNVGLWKHFSKPCTQWFIFFGSIAWYLHQTAVITSSTRGHHYCEYTSILKLYISAQWTSNIYCSSLWYYSHLNHHHDCTDTLKGE